jgi:hypothetical protein
MIFLGTPCLLIRAKNSGGAFETIKDAIALIGITMKKCKAHQSNRLTRAK